MFLQRIQNVQENAICIFVEPAHLWMIVETLQINIRRRLKYVWTVLLPLIMFTFNQKYNIQKLVGTPLLNAYQTSLWKYYQPWLIVFHENVLLFSYSYSLPLIAVLSYYFDACIVVRYYELSFTELLDSRSNYWMPFGFFLIVKYQIVSTIQIYPIYILKIFSYDCGNFRSFNQKYSWYSQLFFVYIFWYDCRVFLWKVYHLSLPTLVSLSINLIGYPNERSFLYASQLHF